MPVHRSWQQGFYGKGEIGVGTPDVCVSCAPPRNAHVRVPMGQLYVYESDNLMETLAQLNITPNRLQNLSVVASGHAFTVDIFDVALVAKE